MRPSPATTTPSPRSTRSTPGRRAVRALLAFGVLGALVPGSPALVRPAAAQATAADDLPPASERLGLTRGRHRLSLFAGQQLGGLAREANLDVPPIDEHQQFRIDFESSSVLGLRYAYHFHERWGVEISVSRASSELDDGDAFDPVAATALLEAASVQTSVIPDLVARLGQRDGPFDLDLTLVDLGLVFVANPRDRWVAELGAGIGWSSSSLDASPAIFEPLVVTEVMPFQLVNTLPAEDPTDGAGCPFPDDPCIEMTDASGLTWHVGGGVSFAFNDTVHLRMLLRARFIEQVTDPGDSFLMPEATVGISFLLGGR